MVVLIIIMASFNLFAQTRILHDAQLQDKHFQTSQGCGLKRFSLASFDSELNNLFGDGGISRHSMMAAVWETNLPGCVKDYAVVQFIRGCIYNLIHDPKTGEQKKYLGTARLSRGQNVLFHHPQWVVDSSSVDPLYNSYDEPDANEANRFDWHQFATKPLLLRPKVESLKADQKVFFESQFNEWVLNSDPEKLKQIFVTAMPIGSDWYPRAFGAQDGVNVSSLEFRTCLYYTKDVPVDRDPTAQALQCFEWSDRAVFTGKDFERTQTPDPICQ